ncbi:MAG: glycoside hydrolase family 38 C-terminal domain-containing protein [Clostridia bacterium]|nr:glycoside hydrolase family 38 C-terminal domain-containing protein [Clostridia bacterium]
MNTYSKIMKLKETAGEKYWQNRIAAQLLYLYNLSEMQSLCAEKDIAETVDSLWESFEKYESVLPDEAKKAEEKLSEYSEQAKKMTAHLVAHAHIDMNWMWGIQETAAVTVDTMRTMLGFMREYPEFTFSQSQASVYEIIEKYAPEQLIEIKERIKEGRWEVSASTWVENDKNMSDFESQARQILYTKKYLAELLGIDANKLELDFEPDTFGHSENVPAILAAGGVKYYYHCRGYEGETVYNWEAPSGERLLCYREPKWYNADITPYSLSDMPRMTAKYGLSDMLLVYGVGDHGGGPTRRDLNALCDMKAWPLYPEMKFSSYGNFFKAIEPYRDNFPTVKGELNFLFTGCYTTQSRLKKANKLAEARLYDSEMLSAAAYESLRSVPREGRFAKAWENTLFNQFHDILPGSGMNETREYGMALFQETLALSNAEEQKAVRALTDNIDTSAVSVSPEKDGGESEGGGVGYSASHVQGYMFPQTERGAGDTRIVHVFNTTSLHRHETAEIVLFDYTAPLSLIKVTDSKGCDVPFTVAEHGQYYWKHHTTKLYITADLPPFSYETYVVSQREDDRKPDFLENITHRVHNITDAPVFLENELIRAEFDKTHMTLKSLTDKRTGEEKVREGSASFDYIRESNRRGESSWIVSEFMSLESINEKYDVKYLGESHTDWEQKLKYTVAFGTSDITAEISLKKGSPLITYDIWVNWTEPGSRGTYIPQLRFSLKEKEKSEKYIYDIPMGTKERAALSHDVPAISCQLSENGLLLLSSEKYGFRGYDGTMSLTLLRSSFDPDPYPELGRHQIKFAFGIAESVQNAFDISKIYRHPLITFPGTKHEGKLPMSGSFFKVSGAKVSAVKVGEDNNSLVFRLYSTEESEKTAEITLNTPVRRAHLCDLSERIVGGAAVAGNKVSFRIGAKSAITVKITV